MNFSKYIDYNQKLLALDRVRNDLSQLLRNDNKIVFTNDSQIIVTNRFMTLLNQIRYKSRSDQLIFEVIYAACVRLEKSFGDCSKQFIAMLIEQLTEVISYFAAGTTTSELKTLLKQEEKIYCKCINDYAERLPFKQIIHQAKIQNKLAKNIIQTAINMGGLQGTVRLDKQSGKEHIAIEYTQGCEWRLPIVTMGTQHSKVWQQRNVRCLIVDGFIERVSELHHIFEACSKRNEPLILFCRGLNDDVITTILTNRLRKTLNVHAVVVAFNETSANILNDIAAVANCDVVSSLKGEVISMIDYDSIAILESVYASDQCITIINQSAATSISSQLKYLMQKRDKSVTSAMQELYEDRIKSLTSSLVNIKIPINRIDSLELTEQIENGLKTFYAMMTLGCVKRSLINEHMPNDLTLLTPNTTTAHIFNKAPICSRALVVQMITECCECLNNIALTQGMIISS